MPRDFVIYDHQLQVHINTFNPAENRYRINFLSLSKCVLIHKPFKKNIYEKENLIFRNLNFELNDKKIYEHIAA